MNPMISKVFFCLLLTPLIDAGVRAASNADWPGWRGPTRDGIAAPGQNPPLEWSETQAVLWKVPLPGRGHGSPTVVGDRVYLPTADVAKGSQSVLSLDRATGKLVWNATVHQSGADAGHHANSSAASSTVTFDRDRLFINFLNNGAVYASALSLEGKLLWQQRFVITRCTRGLRRHPCFTGRSSLWRRITGVVERLRAWTATPAG